MRAKPKQQREMFELKRQQPIRFFVDGAGARPDGKGSGYLSLRTDTGEKQFVREDGLTNNQAEYKAILLVVESVPKNTALEICTDSVVVCQQLNGKYAVREPKLMTICNSIQEVIRKKNLSATFLWVRREENLAGKLL
jgi:ribonuclease HI